MIAEELSDMNRIKELETVVSDLRTHLSHERRQLYDTQRDLGEVQDRRDQLEAENMGLTIQLGQMQASAACAGPHKIEASHILQGRITGLKARIKELAAKQSPEETGHLQEDVAQLREVLHSYVQVTSEAHRVLRATTRTYKAHDSGTVKCMSCNCDMEKMSPQHFSECYYYPGKGIK